MCFWSSSWFTRLSKHSLNFAIMRNKTMTMTWTLMMTMTLALMMMAMMLTFCPTLCAIRISLTLVVMANVSNSFVSAAISYKLGPVIIIITFIKSIIIIIIIIIILKIIIIIIVVIADVSNQFLSG